MSKRAFLLASGSLDSLLSGKAVRAMRIQNVSPRGPKAGGQEAWLKRIFHAFGPLGQRAAALVRRCPPLGISKSHAGEVNKAVVPAQSGQ